MTTTSKVPLKDGMDGFVSDWASDQRAFKGVPWGKAMMWIFLLSDTFIFSIFLISYMTARWSTVEPWPNTSEVFALTVNGVSVPLLLIAIMTFILITSSGTMAMAVRSGYQKKRKQAAALLYLTAVLGLSFVGMQAFEWTKLIEEGIRPWENPFGARQFGSIFFMVTGFHGFHVFSGVVINFIIFFNVVVGTYDKRGHYEMVEKSGLYWHFVDLVWVFVFTLFYLI